ncbi:MAG: DUF3037 domain-containing protein [Planctomycetes bacterium]|nr:DUF3037 domain-containing protein [Planctomycetota bacterium]
MSAFKGYYSVIQYCPDRSRMEAANIGVLLLCPETGFVKVRMDTGNDRIAKFFGRNSFDKARLNAAKRSIEHRVEIDPESFSTPEDLVRFMDSRGNDLLLTAPRPTKVQDPEAELTLLFQELVGGRERRATEPVGIPRLDEVFLRSTLKGRVVLNPTVEVPVVGYHLKVPYAFRNGVLNLVKPQRFAGDERQAAEIAGKLALHGDLLQRHPDPGEPRKLIVVTAYQSAERVTRLRRRVDDILADYHVRVVHEDQIEALYEEVERTAHP